jgi:uncharacterized membrane protein
MTEPATGAGPVKPRFRDAPRWMAGALLASLALNLLVLGLAAGAAWHVRGGQQAMGGGNLLGNLLAFSQTLPAPRRSELAAVVRDPRQQPELRAQRQEVRMARREVMRLFTADPFDLAAFRAAEARAAEIEGRMRNVADGMAADLAKQLTSTERAAFLKWREQRRGRMRPEPIDEPPAKAAGKP